MGLYEKKNGKWVKGAFDPAGGAVGESGGYYIPKGGEDGFLRWTASKAGMPAVEEFYIKGPKGDDYVLTDADKVEIAEASAAIIDAKLLDLIGTGEVG